MISASREPETTLNKGPRGPPPPSHDTHKHAHTFCQRDMEREVYQLPSPNTSRFRTGTVHQVAKCGEWTHGRCPKAQTHPSLSHLFWASHHSQSPKGTQEHFSWADSVTHVRLPNPPSLCNLRGSTPCLGSQNAVPNPVLASVIYGTYGTNSSWQLRDDISVALFRGFLKQQGHEFGIRD